jgi:ribosomal protein S18 acetylase RimI-like enzyme
MIQYRTELQGIMAEQLQGFFEGWPNPPSPETHLRLLAQSSRVVLALDDETGQVVGFVTALSDEVLCAYIPLLEVLPAYRGAGIGRALVRHLLAQLQHLYMIDLMCDPELEVFYAQFNMRPAGGMMLRQYDRQSGA